MEPTKCSSFNQYHNYLINLLHADDMPKFHFDFLENLVESESVVTEDHIIEKIQIILLKLLKKCDKHNEMSFDISYAFSITLFLKRFNFVHKPYVELFKCVESPVGNLLPRTEETAALLKENAPILIIGLLKFFDKKSYSFDDVKEYRILNFRVKKLVSSLLLQPNEINILLSLADSWLSFVAFQNETKEEFLMDIYSSVISIAVVHWNHHISEFRRRIELLFMKCLSLNYEEIRKQKPQMDSLCIIVRMKTFQTFACNMFWSVPFKYFAYLIGLKFIAKVYSISKFMQFVQNDLREGFLKTLQNKRIIGVETDLFKFCIHNANYQEWKEIFHPLICTVISSKDFVTANNFSRLWLPVIVKKFPDYCKIIYECLPENVAYRTAANSRILFSLLKICYSKKVILPPMADENTFLSYCDNYLFDEEEVRGELFALLCNLHDQSVLHTEEEFRLILKFLKYNVHSSCTILRQHIISSFAAFILRLICSCVRILKTTKQEHAEARLKHFLQFLKDLNDFFVSNIEPGCSYQRKVTSLTLYKIFMTYAVRDCGGEIRKNNLKDVKMFSKFVKEHDMWNFNDKRNCSNLFRCLVDPCDEIQRLSFVLLKTYFDITAVDNKTYVFLNVLEMLKDNQFYKRNSGVSACLSVIALSYNTEMDTPLNLLSDLNFAFSNFTDYFLYLLENQILVLQKDTLNSALYHPLDATIKVLTFLVSDISSPEYNLVTRSHIEKLITLLELIVPTLLKALFFDKLSDYAPSFEESDKALQAIIEKSEIVGKLKIENAKEDEFQLKPLNQILLNFIWIALKACCEFESKLVSSRIKSLNDKQLVRCCNLVVNKLKLCRHKGVIEAAGIALSDVVRTLTSYNICEEWLESVLKDIIFLIEYRSSATISRKSAGLSLLVQNIVANDRRPNKPLLKKCWSEFRRILNVDFDKINVDVSQELPQVHVLHFMQVLIADARNSSELSIYFEEMTIVCLKTLNVPIWTIRNASLQLFGAIMPKMVGQKNSQNDFGVRRSFEEVFLCMPGLLDHIVDAFEQCVCENSLPKLIRHADLVPFLIILGNVQVCDVNLMEKSLRGKLLRLRQYAEILLNSESYFVRKLASKTFISLYSENEISIFQKITDNVIAYLIYEEPISVHIVNENHLHGYLLVLEQAYTLYSRQWRFRKSVIDCRCFFTCSMDVPKVSLISAKLMCRLGIKSLALTDWTVILSHVTRTLDELDHKKHLLIGYDEWTKTMIEIAFNNCTDMSFKELFVFCLNSSYSIIIKNYLTVFSSAHTQRNNFIEENFCFVFDSLWTCMKKYMHRIGGSMECATTLMCLFNALVQLPIKFNLKRKNIYFEDIFDSLINLNFHEYHALNLRVLCLFCDFPITISRLNFLLKEVRETLDVARYHKDIRLNSAQSVLLLCDVVHGEKGTDLKTIWLAVADMVQDEDPEVRTIGCKCYHILTKAKVCLSPELVLMEMFDWRRVRPHLPDGVIIDILWDTLSSTNFDIFVTTDEIANPFDLGIVSVYKEDIKVIFAAGNSIVNIFLSSPLVIKHYFFQRTIFDYFDEFIEKIFTISEEILKINLLISAPGYITATRCYFLLLIFIKYHELIVNFECNLCSIENNINAVCSCKENYNMKLCFRKIEKCCKQLGETFNFTMVR